MHIHIYLSISLSLYIYICIRCKFDILVFEVFGLVGLKTP